MHDAVWLNARLATMAGPVIPDGAIAVTAGRISWVGGRRDWKGGARVEHDARGAWILPGFVDCHTHLVYAGSRAHEFELRLKGASYEEIATAGGGILSTVRATRAASQDELLALAKRRLREQCCPQNRGGRRPRVTRATASKNSARQNASLFL
jgi:imidazolonepropionase